MKRRRIIFFVLLSLSCSLFMFTFANATYEEDLKCNNLFKIIQDKRLITRKTFLVDSVLPGSLKILGDGAFEGTNLHSIIVTSSIKYIGERTFADMQNLFYVYIPDATIEIDDKAFENSKKTIIRAFSGNEVEKWARKTGLPFQPIAAVNTTNESNQLPHYLTKDKQEQKLTQGSFRYGVEIPKCRDTGRLIDDIILSRYKGISLFFIQGRSPPSRKVFYNTILYL